MKCTSASFIVLVLLVASAMCLSLSAQESTSQLSNKELTRYQLIDFGTFGGPASYVNIPDAYAPVLNNRGTVAGSADTAEPDPYPNFCFNQDCFVSHAFKADDTHVTDLGGLSDGASSGANWISPNGLIAGLSENGQIDPLIPGFPELRAVLWNQGKIMNLGTLKGGHESAANAVNNRGQVVGVSLNGVTDPFSMTGLGYQTRAILWQNGKMRDLGTLGGTDAEATLLNERGQIVGESYISSDPSPYCANNLGLPLSTGAFLWQKDKMENLGSFGGTCTFATDLNNRGQVVGLSTLPGDQGQHPFLWDRGKLTDLGTFGGGNGSVSEINEVGDAAGWAAYPDDQMFHAALWKNGNIVDLGTIGNDPFSFAFSINAKGQIAGFSSNADFSEPRAFLWQDGGPMVDLNTLIPASSTLYLTTPETINDRGEIAGIGLDSSGNEHAFLLIPCGSNGSCQQAAAGSNVNRTSPVKVSSASAFSIRQLMFGRPALRHFPKISPIASSGPQWNTPAALSGAEPAPSNLSSHIILRGDVEAVVLKWTDNSSNEDSFRIERCTGSTCTNFAQIATTGANTTSYFNGVSFRLRHTFRYRVRAHGPSGYSAYSNITTIGTF